MTYLNLLSKVFLIFSILCIFLSCENDDPSADTKVNDNSLVVGYWLLHKGQTFAINSHGEKILTATLNPKVFAHEFLADGTYIGHDLTGSTSGETGTWKLEVRKKDVNDIEEGTLTIMTPSTLANKGLLFIDIDGSMNFDITSIFSKQNNNKSSIYLETKKYEAYPYKENWASYSYEKQ